MTWLSLLLCIKIAVSLLLIIIPYLFLPVSRLARMMGTEGQAPLLYRLYGMCVLAIIVGYAFGIPAAEAGRMPWGVIFMGITSNIGAGLMLLFLGKSRKALAPALLFGAIGAGLILASVFPKLALMPVW